MAVGPTPKLHSISDSGLSVTTAVAVSPTPKLHSISDSGLSVTIANGSESDTKVTYRNRPFKRPVR